MHYIEIVQKLTEYTKNCICRKGILFCVLLNIIFSLILISIAKNEDILFYVEKPFVEINSLIREKIANNRNVIIVDIDETSMKHLGKWPLERHKIAKIIDSVSLYNPRAIGIDIVFSEKSDDINDNALNISMERAGNIVLGYVKSSNIFPFNYQERKFEIGFLDRKYDSSGKVIGLQPVIKEKELLYKAFPLVLAEKHKNKQLNMIYKKRLLRINFYGPHNTFKHYSAIEFLNKNIKDRINGNVVILTANPIPMYLNTIFGNMSTGEVNANIVQNIIDNSWLEFNMIIGFAIYVFSGFMLLYFLEKKKKVWVSGLSFLISFCIIDVLLFLKGVIVPMSGFIIILIINYFAHSFFLNSKN